MKKKRTPEQPPSKTVVPVPKPPPASSGPVFVATFADGTETRMSIYSGTRPARLEARNRNQQIRLFQPHRHADERNHRPHRRGAFSKRTTACCSLHTTPSKSKGDEP